MITFFRIAVFLGLFGLTAGCGNVYRGEVTGTVESEERAYQNANGSRMTVRVDVQGRDTVFVKKTLRTDNVGGGSEELGIRYFSQVTITGADGKTSSYTVPDGEFRQTNGKTHFESRVLLGSTDRPSGYDTPGEAMAAAWAVVSSRIGDATRVISGNTAPGAGIDSMIGAITTAAK